MLAKTHHVLVLLIPVLLGACASQPSAGPANSRFYGNPILRTRDRDLMPTGPIAPSPMVRGTGKVVSVDPVMGHVVLDCSGQRVEAYWQTEWTAAQGGTLGQSANGAGVGVYREPEVHTSAFMAHPGDTIVFVGMRTGDSIFLQGIGVVTP